MQPSTARAPLGKVWWWQGAVQYSYVGHWYKTIWCTVMVVYNAVQCSSGRTVYSAVMVQRSRVTVKIGHGSSLGYCMVK